MPEIAKSTHGERDGYLPPDRSPSRFQKRGDGTSPRKPVAACWGVARSSPDARTTPPYLGAACAGRRAAPVWVTALGRGSTKRLGVP